MGQGDRVILTPPHSSFQTISALTNAYFCLHSAGDKLGDQLQGWLDAAGEVSVAPSRAIITPHAGYSYSGACAGYAYKQIDPEKVHRVFLLGPSHHEYIRGCALSSFKEYETPLGSLHLDQGVYADLQASGLFETMPPAVDEAEHRYGADYSSIIVSLLVGMSAQQLCCRQPTRHWSAHSDCVIRSLEMQLPYIAKVTVPDTSCLVAP